MKCYLCSKDAVTTFGEKLVCAKVHIRLKSMKWLADLPGCDNGEVTLHVARQERDQAAEFVQMLQQVP